MQYLVKIISTENTFLIRQPVLRKNQPIETCFFNGDNDAETFHLGLFDREVLIGVLSVYQVNNHFFKQENQVQFRGMALLEKYQGLNLGSLLIEQAEAICLNKKTELIWFNARQNAINFYLKNNYKTFGDLFEISNVGRHILMYKYL